MELNAKWYISEINALAEKADGYKKELAKKLNSSHVTVYSDNSVAVDWVPDGVYGRRIKTETGEYFRAYYWKQDGIDLCHFSRRSSDEDN